MKEKSKHMNIPKIRFKGFEDTWKNDKIGNIGSVLMCKRIFKSQTSSIGDIPFYKIGTFGSTADAFISENLFNEYKTRFSYPQYGDILLSAAGTIGRIVEYKGEKAYFQDSNIVWVKVNGKIKNQFLKYIYSCIKWNGLEGSTIKRLYNNNILETAINYPSPEEQQKIASYFQSLDSLIQTISKKLASLKQIKAASLQSMFPQEGETVPKVRFKGFKGEWDNDFISNVCKITTGKSNTQDQVKNGLYPFFIRSENIARSNKYLYDCEAVITIGDGNIGRVFHYINGKFDLHQRCYMMRNFRNVSALYFYYYFSAFFYDRAIKMSAKATVDSVRLNMIADMNILYPKNKLEQQKIASYFCNLDKQISLQTQRLEKLKQIKAACLDKMFV